MDFTQTDIPQSVLARPILVPRLRATSISYLERARLPHDKFMGLQAVSWPLTLLMYLLLT